MNHIDNLASKEMDSSEPDVRFVTDRQSQSWSQAAKIEFDVFYDSGYIDAEQELEADYERYLPETGFILTKRQGLPAGSVRVIFYDNELGFKTLNDAKKGELEISQEGEAFINQIPKENMMEIGTISIPETLRGESDGGLRVVTDLYGGIYALGKQKERDWVIASFDSDYLDRFGKIFGPSITELGPAKEYMGSPTVPVVLNLDQALKSIKDLGLKDTFDSIVALQSQLKHEH